MATLVIISSGHNCFLLLWQASLACLKTLTIKGSRRSEDFKQM